MAKTIFLTILILLLCSFNANNDNAPCVSCVYLQEVGVKELTGNNDGARVEEYQKATGNKRGDSYCASFVVWCFKQAGVTTTITAWSPTAENRKNLVYSGGEFIKEPREADVFTIYSQSKKRICHTGFFHKRINDAIYESVEANTNDNGSSNGDGVYKRKRSFRGTHSISRWF